MTTPTEAMRLALDALTLTREQLAGDRLELIACHAWPVGSGSIPEHDRAGTQALCEYDECLSEADAAITALREALSAAPPPPAAQADELKSAFAQLAAQQKPLDADIAKVLHDNMWDLLVEDDAPAAPQPPAAQHGEAVAPSDLRERIAAAQEAAEDGDTSGCFAILRETLRVLDAQPAAAPQPVAQGDAEAWQRAARDWATSVGAMLSPSDDPTEALRQIVNAAREQVRTPAAAPSGVVGEPLFLLHCGQIDSDGEQDDWDIEADSGKRVEEFARQHPGQTIKLYTDTPARQALTQSAVDAIVNASREADEGPTALLHRVERACAEAWGVPLAGIGGKGEADHG